jgi:N-formylglutamate amidohydrolase
MSIVKSSDPFTFHHGSSPLLLSIPHDGRKLKVGMSSKMTKQALLLPDTDWYINNLYDFSHQLEASVISADYSRYVVDLNRSSEDLSLYEDQISTGLCPLKTFSNENIYSSMSQINSKEINQRIEKYWSPYHEKIKTVLRQKKKEYGYALLWDAHSIKTCVPDLFEGKLPYLNIGTNSGKSCPQKIEDAVYNVAKDSTYSSVLNQRFKGGFITRHYGTPQNQLYAIQLEIAQSCYMNESSLTYDIALAKKLTITLKKMLETFMMTAEKYNKSLD